MGAPKLMVDLRDNSGKNYAVRLRKDNLVPGVMYGREKETKLLKVNKFELQKFINRYGYSSSLNLELDGKTIPAIIKEVQMDTIKDEFLHVDFQQLTAGEKIKISIPIVLIGKEKIEDRTAIIQQQLDELEIQCLPQDIPQAISLNVSSMKFGEALTVGDLDVAKDEKIEILNELTETIVSLTAANRAEKTDEEEEEVSIYESEKSILE